MARHVTILLFQHNHHPLSVPLPTGFSPNPTLMIPFSLPPLLVIFILLASLWYLFNRFLLLPHRLRSLKNRHVWVVGASRGLGRALACQFAKHGAIVSISARNQSALQSLSHHLRPNQGALIPLDVTESYPHILDALTQVYQIAPLDILIVNAAINQSALPFEALPIEKADSLIDTNFRSVVRLFNAVLPRLTPRGGTVCAISSLAAYRGVPGATVYAATKAAVTTFCQALAVELYSSNINVVCVHPGFIDTPAIKNLNHPKPFLVDEQTAASEVINAIVTASSHYAFPWPMEHIVMRFSRLLPTPLYNFILHHTA